MQSSFVNNRANQDSLLAEADKYDTSAERVTKVDAMLEASGDSKYYLRFYIYTR